SLKTNLIFFFLCVFVPHMAS
ncbi:TPA: protein YthA, partial [Escherichia coli]|nr:hypothetical protein [Escherichia coli]